MSAEMTTPNPTSGSGPPGAPGPGGGDAASAQERAGETVQQTGREARRLADEGKEQLRGLGGDARKAVRERADERVSTLASGLADIADDLEAMAGSAHHEGPLPTATSHLAGMARDASQRLEHDGAQAVVDDVRRFARQRPGMFLGVAFGLGIVAGRMLRGDIDERQEGHGDDGRDIDLRDWSNQRPLTRTASAGAQTDGPDPRDLGLSSASAPVGGGLAGGELA